MQTLAFPNSKIDTSFLSNLNYLSYGNLYHHSLLVPLFLKCYLLLMCAIHVKPIHFYLDDIKKFITTAA